MASGTWHRFHVRRWSYLPEKKGISPGKDGEGTSMLEGLLRARASCLIPGSVRMRGRGKASWLTCNPYLSSSSGPSLDWHELGIQQPYRQHSLGCWPASVSRLSSAECLRLLATRHLKLSSHSHTKQTNLAFLGCLWLLAPSVDASRFSNLANLSGNVWQKPIAFCALCTSTCQDPEELCVLAFLPEQLSPPIGNCRHRLLVPPSLGNEPAAWPQP